MTKAWTLALAAGLATTPAMAAPGDHWLATWATAEQLVEPQNMLPPEAWQNATIRQIVRVSVGGTRFRLRLSNAFGAAPLHLLGVHVARAAAPGAARILAGSDRALTFAGRADVTIPAGADYLSDPVDLPVPALSSLAISLRTDSAPARQTGHPGSRATSWIAAGDLLSAADLPGARGVDHWVVAAAVEAEAPGAAVVTLGDSITDGHGATTNGDDRWPDKLAERLQAAPATRGIAVLNVGIGGNRLLLDGIGPNALARFDRDVLAQPGARWLILLEGVNDLGTATREAPIAPAEHQALVARILAAYAQIVTRAHAHGIAAIGATILPFTGSDYYHPDAAAEADRQAINRWIRAPGHFDSLVDFDAVTRDPAHPERLLPAFDSGDHLHPSPAGYRAMADSIPLALFRIH